MKKFKYLAIPLMAVLIFLMPSIAYGAELQIPAEIVHYAEEIDIKSDGKALVNIEIQITGDQPGTYIVPLGNKDAENLRVVSPRNVEANIVSDKGVKFIGLTFSNTPRGETVQLSYVIPKLINFSEASRDNLGRVRFRYGFQNSVSTTIDMYELKVLFPAPYKVHFSGEIMNIARARSSNADSMQVLYGEDQRGGFLITKEGLRYGQTSSHTLETTDKSQFSFIFAFMLLLFAVWSLIYYKDRLVDTGEEKKLVKSFDASKVGTS